MVSLLYQVREDARVLENVLLKYLLTMRRSVLEVCQEHRQRHS